MAVVVKSIFARAPIFPSEGCNSLFSSIRLCMLVVLIAFCPVITQAEASVESEVAVMTDSGSKPMGKVTSTDEVYSFDQKTQKFLLKKVTNITGSDTVQIVEVHLAGGEKIVCTPDQAFWVERQGWTQPRNPFSGDQAAQGWKQARYLFPGDQIKTREGAPVKVYNITVRRAKTHVYHLQIEDSSNYCVGSQGLVVSS